MCSFLDAWYSYASNKSLLVNIKAAELKNAYLSFLFGYILGYDDAIIIKIVLKTCFSQCCKPATYILKPIRKLTVLNNNMISFCYR